VSRRSLATLAAISVSWLAATSSGASQLSVGSGSSFSLGSGTLNLGCASLLVAGSFDVISGSVEEALDVTIASGGTLDGGSGTLDLAGNWDNGDGGTFNAGTGSINFVDGCGVLSPVTITGSTTFSTLTLTTTTGKTYQFEAGSTQTIGVALSLTGVAGNLLTLRSTSPGSAATLDVQGSGTGDFLDVADLHVTPNPIVFGPNSTVGSNTVNVSQCGDINGDFSIDAADIALARNHLVGKPTAGDISLCNVIGPFDPGAAGADCGVDDVFVLRRLAAGESVTAVNACKP
jgi:hypothetical protein